MNDDKKVKCQDCGYLTAWCDGELVEVTRNQRMTGERPSSKVQYLPICHEDAHPISTEYAPSPDLAPSGDARGRRYLEVITADRVCGKFAPYQPGRSPEQHRHRAEAESDAERDHMREFEILKWQADEASKSREWQEEQAAKRVAEKRQDDADLRRWQEEQDKKRGRTEMWRWLLTGIGGAVVAAVAFFGGRHYAEKDRIDAEQRAEQKSAKN